MSINRRGFFSCLTTAAAALAGVCAARSSTLDDAGTPQRNSGAKAGNSVPPMSSYGYTTTYNESLSVWQVHTNEEFRALNSDELVRLAKKHPAPDSWWEEG